MPLLRPALALSLTLAAVGCGDSTQVGRNGPGGKADSLGTFEEFKETVYCEPDTDTCIVQGDVPVFSEAALRDWWQGAGGQALTVMRNQSDAIWDRTKRFDLRYCISDKFGDDKDEIVKAMNEAVADWEAIASVKFLHATDQDDRCNKRNAQVVFDVSPAPEFAFYFARAFFPDTGTRADRRVLINMPSIDDSMDDDMFDGKLNLRGILRHELGHVLGFRHEHIRPENTGNLFCFETDDFRPITEYDNKSVMHYPQCEGEGDWSLKFTTIDKQGARFFYPDFERFRGGRCTIEVRGNGKVNDSCEPIVHEILELANTATFDVLDDFVGLDVRAVEEVVAGRGTQPFNSLDQLGDVTFLGDATVRRMYDYLYVDGRCPVELDNEGRVDTLCRPVVHRVLEFANRAPFEELDVDASLDRRAAENIVERRGQLAFTDLAELWAVSFVKERALRKMYDYIYGE